MNNIRISVPTKIILTSGTTITLAALIVSGITYIGAGRFFDYYLAIDISTQLLGIVRSCGFLTMVGGVLTEYLKPKQ